MKQVQDDKDIKLSDKQKEVIAYMRQPGAALIWRSRYNRYDFNDNGRITNNQAKRLIEDGLIIFDQYVRFDAFFELTELGRKINL